MPQTPQNNQDLKELDLRVSALLDQMHAASDRILQHLDESDPYPTSQPSDLFSAPPPAPQSAAAHADDDLGHAVDAMIEHAASESVHQTPATETSHSFHADPTDTHETTGHAALDLNDTHEPEETESAPVERYEPEPEPIALAQPDRPEPTYQQPVRGFEPPVLFRSTSEPVAPEPVTIARLDENLAIAGDEMIEGEIEDESTVLEAAASRPPPIAPSRSFQPPPAPPSFAPSHAETTAGYAAPPATISTALASKAPTAIEVRRPNGASTPGRKTPGRVGPAMLKAMDTASAPVRHKPNARRIAGYVAVITAFNALCLLGYNFLIREPHPPAPTALDPSEDPARIDPRAKPADSHGASAPTTKPTSSKPTNSHGVEVSPRSKVKPAAKRKTTSHYGTD